VSQYSKFWNAQLDSLEMYLSKLQGKKKKKAIAGKIQKNKKPAAIKRRKVKGKI
jgi:hypothetical protein